MPTPISVGSEILGMLKLRWKRLVQHVKLRSPRGQSAPLTAHERLGPSRVLPVFPSSFMVFKTI